MKTSAIWKKIPRQIINYIITIKFALFIYLFYLCIAKLKNGALAHLARAFDWQSRGGEFESRMLHKTQGCYDVAPLCFFFNTYIEGLLDFMTI